MVGVEIPARLLLPLQFGHMLEIDPPCQYGPPPGSNGWRRVDHRPIKLGTMVTISGKNHRIAKPTT